MVAPAGQNLRASLSSGDLNQRILNTGYRTECTKGPLQPPLAWALPPKPQHGLWLSSLSLSAVLYLLQGCQIPDSDSVVLGHSGQLSSVALGGEGQHQGSVGAHQHIILPGGNVQEAQMAQGGGGQHTKAIGAESY